MNTLRIATSRIAYNGANRLDITVKSATGAGKILAPTWAMVMALKHGKITSAEYAEAYYLLMRTRYRDGYPKFNGNPFDQFIRMERVVLCCYCRAGDFCHRHLAADILAKIAEKRGVSVILEGKI